LFSDSRKEINHGIPSDQLAFFNPVLFNFAKDAQRLATLLLFGQGFQPPFHGPSLPVLPFKPRCQMMP